MKAVIQRVECAAVSVDGKTVGKCEKGYMILFCALENDTREDIDVLAKKVVNLRIFDDPDGKMNLSILDISGEILCISQFTLAADTKKGNRPSFVKALEPVLAEQYYHDFCGMLRDYGVKSVEQGIFGAEMKVSLANDGPVTIILDTDIRKKKQ